jgi:hypothetical protein
VTRLVAAQAVTKERSSGCEPASMAVTLVRPARKDEPTACSIARPGMHSSAPLPAASGSCAGTVAAMGSPAESSSPYSSSDDLAQVVRSVSGAGDTGAVGGCVAGAFVRHGGGRRVGGRHGS